MHMKIRKSFLLYWQGGRHGRHFPPRTRLLDSPSRKLRLAEFAISNLYVDKVDEDNWS